MRVVIRNEIDIDKPLNLRRLSPVTKVIVAFRKQLQSSVFFEKRRMKAEQAKNRARIVKEDSCKESISTRLYQELVLNKSMQNTDSVIREVVIAVNAEYSDVIHDQKDEDGSVVKPSIFRHNDFSQYEIVPVQENVDLRIAFPEMPYLFVCSRKSL